MLVNKGEDLLLLFDCIPASLYPPLSSLFYGLWGPFVSVQEGAHALVWLVSCFVLSCLPICCNIEHSALGLSIVSLRNCQLSLPPFSFSLTSHESLPICFLRALQSASLKLLVFTCLFYFLLFALGFNAVIPCSLSPKSPSACIIPISRY